MSRIHYNAYNHLDVTVGIYKNRMLQTGDGELALYELRMSHPYRDRVMDADALHSIEHLGLDFLAKTGYQEDKVFFFGTMACRTGCILIVQNMTESEVVCLVEDMFLHAARYEGDMPLMKRSECGNIYGHDPLQAQEYAQEYVAFLKNNPQGDCSYYSRAT